MRCNTAQDAGYTGDTWYCTNEKYVHGFVAVRRHDSRVYALSTQDPHLIDQASGNRWSCGAYEWYGNSNVLLDFERYTSNINFSQVAEDPDHACELAFNGQANEAVYPNNWPAANSNWYDVPTYSGAAYTGAPGNCKNSAESNVFTFFNYFDTNTSGGIYNYPVDTTSSDFTNTSSDYYYYTFACLKPVGSYWGCDDFADEDFVGQYDDCGICNGADFFDDSSGLLPNGACDCNGSTLDCNLECGGNANRDFCGFCLPNANSNASEYKVDQCPHYNVSSDYEYTPGEYCHWNEAGGTIGAEYCTEIAQDAALGYVMRLQEQACPIVDVLGVCGGNCIEDSDNDGICDDIDQCIGVYDICDVCNGNGPQIDCS